MGMKNVKRLVTVFVLLFAACTLFASGADIVVLMDASGTILPWFEQVNNRILPDITRKFVRQGDTFHLVSFNSRVNLEVVQPVKNEQDISRIVSRFMLLYPLGINSDFLSGLHYTWQYVSSLAPQGDKIVIVISDGIFNPPDTSTYAGYTADESRDELVSLTRKIRSAGWKVYYIKLPFPDNAVIRSLDDSIILDTTAGSSDAETKEYFDVSGDFTSELDIPVSEFLGEDVPVDFVDKVFALPEVTFPEDIGAQGHFFVLPLRISNVSDETVNMELTGVMFDSVDVLEKTVIVSIKPGKSATLRPKIMLPESVPLGKQSIPLSLRFSNNVRTVPQSGYVTVDIRSFSVRQALYRGGPLAYAVILILLAAILVFLVLFVIARTTSRSAVSAVHGASRKSADSVAGGGAYVSGENRDKNIAYTTGENRDKSIAYTTGENRDKNIAFSMDTDHSADTLAASAAEIEKNRRERFAILSGAAPAHVFQGRSRPGARAGESVPIRENRSAMIELFVSNQNTAIGRRNVHRMKAGSHLTLGGGTSSFLVFLVRFPSRIAEVRFDGIQCSLAILKPEYFPYEDEVVIENCINREITIVSDHGYEVSFKLREFEDPVERLNRMLTSIKY